MANAKSSTSSSNTILYLVIFLCCCCYVLPYALTAFAFAGLASAVDSSVECIKKREDAKCTTTDKLLGAKYETQSVCGDCHVFKECKNDEGYYPVDDKNKDLNSKFCGKQNVTCSHYDNLDNVIKGTYNIEDDIAVCGYNVKTCTMEGYVLDGSKCVPDLSKEDKVGNDLIDSLSENILVEETTTLDSNVPDELDSENTTSVDVQGTSTSSTTEYEEITEEITEETS